MNVCTNDFNMGKADILSSIKKTAKAVAPRDAVVMLFGSRARGDNHLHSDWDILILLDKERILPQDIDEVAYPIRELGWKLNEDINPVLFTKHEWETSPANPFFCNVRREGIVL